MLGNKIYSFSFPVLEDEKTKKSHLLFRDYTRSFLKLSCHFSKLIPEIKSHSVHMHAEEELLLMFSGVIEISLPGKDPTGISRKIHLKKSQIAVYPANLKHSIRTISKHPANYFVLKWSAGFLKNRGLPFRYFDMNGNKALKKNRQSSRVNLFFNGPTSYLQDLGCNIVTILPGASYKLNSALSDVLILMTDGNMETSGKTVRPYDVIYYERGGPEVMYNAGNETARYLVFSFHLEYTFIDKIINITMTIFKRIFKIDSLKRRINILVR